MLGLRDTFIIRNRVEIAGENLIKISSILYRMILLVRPATEETNLDF